MAPPSLNDGHEDGSSSTPTTNTNSTESSRIQALEKEIERLKAENADLQKKSSQDILQDPTTVQVPDLETPSLPPVDRLSPDHIERYSRQLLLSEGFGVAGQKKLLSSSVLVVGAGGIGSTVLLYLAASGIGRISVLDFDRVERSNLHRQVIHRDPNVGVNKAVSACRALNELNPGVDCRPLPGMLTPENALDLVREHDCIVDASDNPRTRYLINDACVLAGRPLVSGSAIGTEGQLSVYDSTTGGPCYRCLYPQPSITAGSKTCSDHGVLGPVPGLIGVLQALEVLKILTNTGHVMNDRLLMYDSLQCSFLGIKKPKKQATCPVCSGPNATIRSMTDSDLNLQSTRGPATCAYLPARLDQQYQISCQEYHKLRIQQPPQPHVLLDVRVKEQFDLCQLENAINLPLDQLQDSMDQVESLTDGWKTPVYCICRRGVFSVEATKQLNDYISKLGMDEKQASVPRVKNIQGGLEAWRNQVDENFPKY